MQLFEAAFAEAPGVVIGVSAFLTGVALFYLTMQRTRKRRLKASGKVPQD